mmetsp:Transcript_26223/g.51489  ORF Transcript_26223/g.51489 Transcript_26223/m.51489 type:complete len:99 (+) Transcript_26223:408-704(+)
MFMCVDSLLACCRWSGEKTLLQIPDTLSLLFSLLPPHRPPPSLPRRRNEMKRCNSGPATLEQRAARHPFSLDPVLYSSFLHVIHFSCADSERERALID